MEVEDNIIKEKEECGF